MPTDLDQPVSEYQQLKETLERYPGIQITQVEGNPPDNYEIEYHLKGYARNPDGSIAPVLLHRIQITLPFGYPHFSPTVKPLTHIFHPDIDPAAIRIAEQWQAKPNLSDLVLTIGEMICGNIYSINDAFNQKAADWYEQHSGDLPLDSLQKLDTPSPPERCDTLDEDAITSLDSFDDEHLDSGKEKETQEATVAEDKSDPPPLPPKEKRKKTHVSAGISIPIKPILTGALVILLIVSGVLYMQDKKILDQGQNDWQKVDALVSSLEFAEARTMAESVLNDLKKLKLFKFSAKSLTAKINTLLNSDDFQQGLQGNILYEERYISFIQAEKLQELAMLTSNAEELIEQDNPQEALTAYQKAVIHAHKHGLATQEQELRQTVKVLLESHLSQMLISAKTAYERGEQERSIKQYQAVLHLLDTQKEGFGPGIEDSYVKIEKTLLMIQIAREQSKAERARKKNTLSELVTHYDKILKLIQTSRFHTDEDLHTLTVNIQKLLANVQKQLYLQKKINNLKENYQVIFKKHYSFFVDSKLTHPAVRFDKDIGNKSLFTMTCIEHSHGSSSRLELQYLYDPDENSWSHYSAH